MNNDRKIVISCGNSRTSKNWQRTELMWSELVEKLRVPQRTAETLEEYFKLPKGQQGTLKDIGGFVGGSLAGPQRKANAVTGRDVVTLDMDNIAAGETDNVLRRIRSLGAAFAAYSTRSHAPWKPRLRVCILLDRTVTADEYEPIARKLASAVGIEMCDPTTFEASRLMYWPGCSKDSPYVFDFEDAPMVSADGVLKQYEDWHDTKAWPQVPGEVNKVKTLLARQQDPTTKEGVVGAFCRTYDIVSAIAAYIPNAYVPTEHDDRLTYTGGSTVAGAVLYDDNKFLYSHHATDPCSGELVNAFDLVRRHLYGELDAVAKDGTPGSKMPSYLAMKKAALADAKVAEELNKTAAAKASDVFQKAEETPGVKPAEGETNVDWLQEAQLQYDDNGRVKKTVDNIVRILLFDPAVKGKIARDDFAVRGMAMGALPWNNEAKPRLWTDLDDAGVSWYLENRFGVTGRDKIEAALLLVSERNKFNTVQEYLEKLEWDGVKRLDMLLIDYLGAEDSDYSKAVSRKFFAAAVARAMNPGTKFDYVPVLIGPQGIGKTTFVATVGQEWYSDSLQNFEGKEAMEMIQGRWINELGELAGLTRAESNTVKNFLSRREDIFRQPYGRRTEKYLRKCVFIGTSNQHEFLRDMTGNRRFWPVDVGLHKAVKSVWDDLPMEVDQIWAEAVMRWRMGELLYFREDLESRAKEQQEKHREKSTKEGLIREFLEKPVPANYDSMDLETRRVFWANKVAGDVQLVPRTKVCALEIWCEVFNSQAQFMKRADTQEINLILENTKGWIRNKSVRRYGYCGTQRGFEKA